MQTSLPNEQIEHSVEHPIERIMDSAFGKIRTLTDADMIVGEPILMPDGTSVIPISKISIGIVSGGGEYGMNASLDYPFAGASGAGMSVQPVCFLVNDGKSVRMMNVGSKSPVDKVIETVPQVVSSLFGKKR